MNRREFILASLSVPLFSQQRRSMPGFASAFQKLPKRQMPRNGVWLVLDAPFSSVPSHDEAFVRFIDALKRFSAEPSLEDLLFLYNRERRRIGGITTFVPPTMQVLSADAKLAKELPVELLAMANPLPLLLGSLSESQFSQLLERGLGFRDLTHTQANLLRAGLPKPLVLHPTGLTDVKAMVQQTKRPSESEIRQQLRLRAHLEVIYWFTTSGPDTQKVLLSPFGDQPTIQQPAWELESSSEDENARALSALFVQEQPTQLKRSELSLSDDALRTQVSLSGATTVAELVERLGKVLQREFFVDPRFATRTLTVLGEPEPKVLVRDLVRALPLALCSTWRRLGDSYLLTHDIAGRAQVQERQLEIIGAWSQRLKQLVSQSDQRLQQGEYLQRIPFNPSDPSAPPRALLLKEKVTWDDLPARFQLDLERQFTKSELRPAVGKTPISLSPVIRFDIEFPETGPLSLLTFHQVEKAPPITSTLPEPAGTIALSEPTRAVLIQATTPEQATALVEQVAKLGFNTLYLTVFFNGRPAFPTSALPPRSAESSKTLAAAIKAGQKHGIAVWATLDLLRWRSNTREPLPSGFQETCSVLQETATATEKRQKALLGSAFSGGTDGWVSPASPLVQKTLIHLVEDLARTEGLAGIAFQKTAMSGFAPAPYYFDFFGIDYGYLPAERVAFLQTNSSDPIDIGNKPVTQAGFWSGSTYIPLKILIDGFDQPGQTALQDRWKSYRVQQARTLLSELFSAVKAVSPELALQLRERNQEQSFEPWTKANELNEVVDLFADSPAMVNQAHPETRVVVSLAFQSPMLFAKIQQSRARIGGGKAKGLVLDLQRAEGDPLAELAALKPYFAPNGVPF